MKGAFRDFYNLLSNSCAQVARAQSCANPAQHIERLSRAIYHVPRGTNGQLNYEVWQSWNRFFFFFFFFFLGLAEPLLMKEIFTEI